MARKIVQKSFLRYIRINVFLSHYNATSDIETDSNQYHGGMVYLEVWPTRSPR